MFSFVYVVDKTSHKEISRRCHESCSDDKKRSVMCTKWCLFFLRLSFFLPIFNFPVPLARSLLPVPIVVSSEAANDWTTSLQFRVRKKSVLPLVHSLSTRFLKGTPYFNLGTNDACIFRACLKDRVCRIIRLVIYTALLSSAEPNAYIMHTLNLWFFPTIPLVFTKLPCAEN